MAKVLKVVGYIWLTLAGALILASYATIVYKDGFGRLAEILSPYNFWNVFAVMLTLAPGLLCLWGADRLADRRRQS
jgi:hypothetical protein